MPDFDRLIEALLRKEGCYGMVLLKTIFFGDSRQLKGVESNALRNCNKSVP